ncbi:hypothetical protein [Marinifilum caeruleilacunae]|uniref:Molybdopterin-guanine dinucleotide biosynthesis protein B (MobB) domain-containing protein n=1 Tax=Marinifilum caeruleilacunae TaxID=2499076 RepID=A0ABX1WT35_9BACT|nr:hypothetical protein [Marinifilum caeruleilacunae]NOU59105.1 hypothetical protein [Marinifilum caeruleilacunae]
MSKKREHIILLAGNGQNVGKTLFACRLIESLKSKFDVVGIKICPHFHELPADTIFIKKTDDYQIIKEYKEEGSKDSNRLLSAGAKEVYYIQAKDDKLKEVLDLLDNMISSLGPVIIESGGLRNILKPGLFLMIENKNNKKLKPQTIDYRKLADVNIEFDGEQFNFDPKNIEFSNQKWVIKN